MQVIKILFHKIIPPQLHPAILAIKQFQKMTNGQVIAGPFVGMKYVKSSIGSVYPSKLMGTYELELQSVIEELCQNDWRTIVDVGAAEGYYAVGMALRCPNARVIAFESETEGQQLILKMAQLNKVVNQITVKGHCNLLALKQILNSSFNCLLIMDVEGEEILLLQPQLISGLKNSEILVELHEHIYPNLSEEISSRFQSTHYIKRIQQRNRTVRDLPFKSPFSRWLLSMITENRLTLDPLTGQIQPLQMSWLYMKPLLKNHKI